MRDLQELYKVCVQECHNANIPIRDKNIIALDIIDEKERCFGCCTREDEKLEFTISIREDLLDKNCPIKELKETIVHELIHTCDRCWGHGKTWMKYARILNNKYGYELTTSKDKDAVFHKEKPILHHFVCPKCGSFYNMRSENKYYNCSDAYCVCTFCRSYYIQID